MLAKVHIVKAMFFLVFMYGCESWTIKKAEHRRIDAFEPLSLILLAQVIPGRRPPPGDANHPLCPKVAGDHSGASSNSREEAPEPQPPAKQPAATDSP